MRPRFVGTRQYPRIIGGTGATQRFRAALSRARMAGKSAIRIDLASLISKYVGQTERNLDRVLDEAHTANALLYIDDADSLFDRERADEDSTDARLRAAKKYLRAGARRRRLLLMTGKSRPEAKARSEP